MKKHLNLFALAAAVFALTACGGGGGGDSSTPGTNNGSAPPSSPVSAGPQTVKLTGLSLRTTDVLATTQPTTKTAALLLHRLDKVGTRLSNMFVGTAMADNCGTLCQPAYPPANIPAQQQLSARLAQNGTLASLSPVFSAATSGTVKCDFTNVGVKVNTIWWLDVKSQNALVNLSVPTSVDSSCNLTYTTGDYVVFGATGQATALNQDVIGDISDMIPAGDQGFNSSTNAIYLSKSTGLVREIQITADGTVSRVDLTAAAQPVCSRGGAFMGNVAYDGTYLVGNASQFSGLMIYKKGDTSFKIIRDQNQNVATPCTTSVVLSDKNEFLAWQNNSIYVVDAVAGTESVWANYAQAPQAMLKFAGRSGTVIGGDRCNYWDFAKSLETSIYAAPTVQTWNLPYAGDITQMLTPLSVAPKYSRVSAGYAYCVTAQMNNFIRQDINTGDLVKLNLDTLGYVPASFQMFSDRAYVVVTNTNNSSVEYIEVNFANNKATYLGTIIAGGREVVSLMQAANGG